MQTVLDFAVCARRSGEKKLRVGKLSGVPFLPLDHNNADLIQVAQSTELWSEYKLDDGATVRVRPILIEVWKDRTQKDPLGNPVYHLNISPVITLVPPPSGRGAQRRSQKKK